MRNSYIAPYRDIEFVLWEQLAVASQLAGSQAAGGPDEIAVRGILNRAHDFAGSALGPLYQVSDRSGCRLGADGTIALPPGFAQAWTSYVADGWTRIAVPIEEDGFGLPYAAAIAVQEMFCGANPAFMILSGFCVPLYHLLKKYGDESLQRTYCSKLIHNQWTACLCMTEPQAGSDVGAITTTAEDRGNGQFALKGTKIFISAGNHPLAENIVYVVLARTKGAPAGTMGLSCFIVPRKRLNAHGEPTLDNHVQCTRLEDKMGLHGCPTVELRFGEDGDSIGHLLGERPNRGLMQLLTMMNQARIATGVYALGMASSAYLNAARYASERIQGPDFRNQFNPAAPRLPIVRHVDVRRMLLEMKAKTEGCRALIYRLADYVTRAAIARALGAEGENEATRLEGLVSLLTPVVKAYTSDQAWRVAELAIQVHGGYGYTKDCPAEQYARDIKVLSIWEGTNFHQAADLLRAKLGFGRDSKLFRAFEEEVRQLTGRAGSKALAGARGELDKGLGCIRKTLDGVAQMVATGRQEVVLANATRILDMVATLAVGWLLLEAAEVADSALPGAVEGSTRWDFYRGKVCSAQFFMAQFFPGIFEHSARILDGDASCLESSAATFSSSVAYW